ncbi:MAG: DNA mismatch repair protein MutS [Duodenibacillus sp.]|nr:DNA mismatch repair protein MutS [Duodenibacillus sp.]
MSTIEAANGPESDPLAGYTPVMRQYLTMKQTNPNCLLLYRLGDFYESFLDDAVKINQLIGLTLTKRGHINGKPIPMCGVPASTLEQYLARLVRLGQSVAICEQIGDASQTKGMMERKIVRVVTPGTITDNALLPEKSDSVLLALSCPKARVGDYGLTWITLTNGEFRAAKASVKDLSSQIARIAPAEILVPDGQKEYVAESLTIPTTVTEMPVWYFDGERGADQLKHRFNLDNLDAWGLENERQILASVNALLTYVEQTQCDALPYIRPLVLEHESSFVGLDAATRRNLELTETLRGDDGPTLFSVIDRCQTSMGSRLLKHWLHHPLREQDQARSRHNAVEEFLCRPYERDDIVEALRAIPDIERIAGRIALRSIRPKEAAALRDALPQLAKLAGLLDGFSCDLLARTRRDIAVDPELHTYLVETLLEEPATLLREGDVIKSSVNDELAALRDMRDNAGDYLAQLEVREKERSGISALRVEYNRVSGYYIEVPKGQANNVPDDYRRRQTLKNTERFITPELKEYEDKALSAKERAAQIERGLWDALLTRLAQWIEPLMQSARAVAAVDVLVGFSLHAHEARWVAPELTESPGIEIYQARHPVVEHMLEQYVPNDCRLVPGRRLLVITGPNMGGKSTYMRSIALIALLAYAGAFVPAQSARLGPIDKILTRIGASDDLARGRSTFMVEMTEAAAILHQATDKSLVLMDEIGRGTSTFDGLSLAGAIAQDLAVNARSWTLFATHYFELTQLGHECSEVVNVHVSAEQTQNGVVFLHDVKEGPASQSYGIAVAGLAGVPARVIRRAKSLLQTLENRAVEQGPQLDLFVSGMSSGTEPNVVHEPYVPEEVTEHLKSLARLDVDDLSPREALNVLYALKDEAEKLL